jgi:hypothetical protein
LTPNSGVPISREGIGSLLAGTIVGGAVWAIAHRCVIFSFVRVVLLMLVVSAPLGCMGPCCEEKDDCPHAVVRVDLAEGSIASPVGTTPYAPDVVAGLAVSETSTRCTVSRLYGDFDPVDLGAVDLKLPLEVHVFCPSAQGNVDVEIDVGDVRKLSTSKPTAVDLFVSRHECQVDMKADVTIESATGGSQTGDAFVTPDFERVVRIDFQAIVDVASTEGHPVCPLQVDVGGTLRFDARASDYSLRNDAPCMACPK